MSKRKIARAAPPVRNGAPVEAIRAAAFKQYHIILDPVEQERIFGHGDSQRFKSEL